MVPSPPGGQQSLALHSPFPTTWRSSQFLGSGAGSVSKHDTLWDIVSAAGAVKDCSDSSEAGHGGVDGNMAC